MNIKKALTKVLAAATVLSLVSGFIPETAKVAEAASITGWTIGAVGGSSVDGEIDNEVKYRGSGSLKYWNHTKDGNGVDGYGALSTVINGVKKGKSYKWGFMAKSLNSTIVNTYIDWGPPRMSLVPYQTTYDWTPYEFTYTHTGDSSQVTMRIVLEDYSEAFWIDDVYFYEVEDGAQNGKNLISNPNFDTVVDSSKGDTGAVVEDNSYEGYLKRSGMLPVYKTESEITIDGDFSDWGEKHDRIALDQVVNIDGGSVDATASYALAWDDRYLYIAVDAEDDKHEAYEGDKFWMGDCMQVTLSADTGDRTYGTEMGFALHSDGKSEVHQSTHNDMQFKAVREGTNTKYEIAIPWAMSFGTAPESLLLNMLVNDTDDAVRKYCLELDPKGISYLKSAQNDPKLLLVDNPSDVPFLSSVSGPNVLEAGTAVQYSTSVYNPTDEAKEFTFAITGGNQTSFTVPAHSKGAAALDYMNEKIGNGTVEFTVSDGEHEQTDAIAINVSLSETLPTKEECEKMLQTMDKYVKDIEPLMTECEFMGLDLPYEKSDAYILERFAELNREKVEAGNYKFIKYQYSKLTEIYNDLKATLESYIKGEATPKSVPRIVLTDDRDEIDGQSFIRDVEYNGEVTKRPYIYVGTGHWAYAYNDLENLKTMGYDSVHIEIGPNQVIYPESFAANWNIYVLGSVPDYSVTLTDEAYTGKYGCKMVNNTPYNYNNFYTVRQEVSVEPNTVYEFGIMAKATNAPNSLKLALGNMAYNDRISMGGTYGWTEFSGTYQTGADETSLNLIITSDCPLETFYFDDAYVKKQGSDENLLQNAGFENGSEDPDSIGNGCKVVYSAIENMENILQKAEDLDMSVDLLITPHYFPTFLATTDPTINDNGKVPTQFMPFNPTHPTVQWVLEKYIEIIVPRFREYKSLHSIVLSNEPAFCASLGEYYLPIFRDHLRELYHNDINELNEAYGGSEYKDFDQINWPSAMTASTFWNDYKRFNDSILDVYHTYLSDAIRKIAPEIPLSTKIMMTVSDAKPAYDHIDDAMNYELMEHSFDLNGNDGGGSAFNGDKAGGIFQLENWYDFLTSVKDAPCINTEDHILSATDTMNYGELVPTQTAAQVWQGAIHGRGGTNLWLWEVKEFGEDNSLLTNRPMVVSKTVKAGFDLNRAAYEVTAIQKTKRRVAIMQSTYSQQANAETYNAYSTANKYVLMDGLRPFWLTDNNYKRIHEFDLVILPDTISISDEAFAEIKKYAENGGKILVLGKRSFTLDENGFKRDENEVAYLQSLALEVVDLAYLSNYVTNREDVKEAVEKAITAAGLDTIVVRDAETGEKVDNVEWLAGSYDGNLCINLHNAFEDGDKTVYIEVDGERVESFTELRSEKEYEDGVITLKPYEPVLVKFEVENPFIDTYGHWAKDTIGNLWQKGVVNGYTESEFNPDSTLTGGEIAALVARVLGYDTEGSENDAHWYDAALNVLAANGVTGDCLANPEEAVTRENIAELCVNAVESKNGAAAGSAVSFSDKTSISADKLSYVEKAASLKLMEGNERNEFNPQGYVTRAEMSRVIENMISAM